MAYFFDERLKLSHRLQGIVNAMEDEIKETLEGALEKVEGKIAALALKTEETESLVRRRKYAAKQREEIEKVLKEIYDGIGEGIKEKTAETAEAAPKITDAMVRKIFQPKIELGVLKLSTKRILAYFESAQIDGLFFNEWLKKLEKGAVDRIMREVRESMILAETRGQTAKRIQNALNVGRHGARGLAHNSIHQAWTWAEREYYLENEERLKGFLFVAELDRSTTPLCRSLDGKIFDTREAPQPPLHWLCRSYLAPIFKWQKEPLGTRIARMDTKARTVHHRDGTTSTKYEKLRVKHPPAKVSYNDWMKSMVNSKNPPDVAFAREALGPTRFNLVNNGKLKMESLYYGGKLRTIKELERLMK